MTNCKNKHTGKTTSYTCNEYREEMILAGLQRALNRPGITDAEREKLQAELQKLEKKMGF